MKEIIYLFSLPTSVECGEDFSLLDNGATMVQLLKEKYRTLISEMFPIRGPLLPTQTGDIRALP